MPNSELKILDKADKKELVSRLSKIEGQVRAIVNMIEKEENCEIVIHQLAAVRQAIHKTFTYALSKVIDNNCPAGQCEDEKYLVFREKLISITKLIEKYL
ncbi:MAG: metal-sensitive transcriptional regulator [Candidatus Calescibacterium sp.]|nr:metal-sensitive transcriptional regulator [Candidatus Calescibacterium sp.]MCX7971992.1 metal-sensitive transcriptional regulator [bacterium]MDW8195480.1 metal-sensitive transcriptional regulator [Candidatus Calescibacterium sp.]